MTETIPVSDSRNGEHYEGDENEDEGMKFAKYFTFRQVLDGESMYAFYGIAWYVSELRATICYPIPFNFLARWIRDLYWMLMVGSKREDLRNEAYNAGIEQGKSLKNAQYWDGLQEGGKQRQKQPISSIRQDTRQGRRLNMSIPLLTTTKC